jgi:hypothetical protein
MLWADFSLPSSVRACVWMCGCRCVRVRERERERERESESDNLHPQPVVFTNLFDLRVGLGCERDLCLSFQCGAARSSSYLLMTDDAV